MSCNNLIIIYNKLKIQIFNFFLFHPTNLAGYFCSYRCLRCFKNFSLYEYVHLLEITSFKNSWYILFYDVLVFLKKMLLNSIHAVLRMFADSVPNFCQCNNYIQGKSVTCCRTAMGRRQRPWRSCERISIRVKSASTDETNMACAWQVNVSSIWFNQEVKCIHSVFLK